VQENDSTAGNADVMQFLSGVATDQIWFRKVGNDLELSIIGSNDKATVQNWYLATNITSSSSRPRTAGPCWTRRARTW
jgi:hypothetical protein